MITIKIGGSVVDDLHSSTISDIKKISEKEGKVSKAKAKTKRKKVSDWSQRINIYPSETVCLWWGGVQ